MGVAERAFRTETAFRLQDHPTARIDVHIPHAPVLGQVNFPDPAPDLMAQVRPRYPGIGVSGQRGLLRILPGHHAREAAWRVRARSAPVGRGFPLEWGGAGFEPGFLMAGHQHHAGDADREHGHQGGLFTQ
ncbi:hypothetical protein [Streptomyces sp. NPDC054765]